MSLFDRLVDEAMRADRDLSPLHAVVEKELLHHDILREMSDAGLLSGLTFIGGTCLRACYGSPRLSEDLDFTGGEDFSRNSLVALAGILTAKLEAKYDLEVRVSEPVQERTTVSTWKVSVQTRPQRKSLPAQRIHIDICALPSHDRRPMLLRNIYGVDMGTSGLILQAESREEILADKLIALAFRANRIKNRDLWDIAWLHQHGVDLLSDLIPRKIADHRRTPDEFRFGLEARVPTLSTDPSLREDFLEEMRRFLPAGIYARTAAKADYWDSLAGLIRDLTATALRGLQ